MFFILFFTFMGTSLLKTCALSNLGFCLKCLADLIYNFHSVGSVNDHSPFTRIHHSWSVQNPVKCHSWPEANQRPPKSCSVALGCCVHHACRVIHCDGKKPSFFKNPKSTERFNSKSSIWKFYYNLLYSLDQTFCCWEGYSSAFTLFCLVDIKETFIF